MGYNKIPEKRKKELKDGGLFQCASCLNIFSFVKEKQVLSKQDNVSMLCHTCDILESLLDLAEKQNKKEPLDKLPL
jgi:hypothetical protein